MNNNNGAMVTDLNLKTVYQHTIGINASNPITQPINHQITWCKVHYKCYNVTLKIHTGIYNHCV